MRPDWGRGLICRAMRRETNADRPAGLACFRSCLAGRDISRDSRKAVRYIISLDETYGPKVSGPHRAAKLINFRL